jgi:predicted Zn-dependent protease
MRLGNVPIRRNCPVGLGIIQTKTINARVGPNPRCPGDFNLLITEGTLDTLPDLELQAMLAHELGHIRLDHFAEAAARTDVQDDAIAGLGVASALASAVPFVGPLVVTGLTATQVVASVGMDLGAKAFTRQSEADADRFAAQLMHKVGGERGCSALPELFERLARDRSAAGGWFSTHPSPANRAKAARARCSEEAAITLARESDLPAPEPPAISPKLAAAIEALRRGDPVALTDAREAAREQPDSALAQEVLGTAALLAKQWQEAELALSEAVRLEPGRASAFLRLGQLALETGDATKAERMFRKVIEIAPQTAPAHYGLAVALLREGQVGRAISEARESLKLSGGKDPEAQYFLAAIYHDVGRPADAEQLLAEVLTVKPDFQQGLLLMGLVKLDLQKTDEATAYLQKVIERDPSSLWARFGLSLISRADGEVAQARAQLESITAEKPQWNLAEFELGRTLLLEGRADAAEQAFARAAQASPNPALMRVRVGQAFLARGNPDRAIAEARAALDSPLAVPSARALLAQAYLAKGSPESAERELRAAAVATPEDPSALVQLGSFYVARRRFDEALAQFQKAATLRPEAVEPLVGEAEAYTALGRAADAVATAERIVRMRDTPQSHLLLGTIQERVGQAGDAAKTYQNVLDREPHQMGASLALAALFARGGRAGDAIRLLREAAEAHPQAALPLFNIGLLQERAGNTAAAVEAYRLALLRDRNNPTILNNLAFLLGKEGGNLDEAIAVAERAYRRAPQNPAVADTFGWLLYHHGELDRAERLIRSAAAALPSNPELHYHLGMVYAKQGKKIEAKKELEAALESPTTPFASAAREALDALR